MNTSVIIWKKYGAYLTGVASIARRHPEATFQQFLNACGHDTGGWGIEALRNSWNKGA